MTVSMVKRCHEVETHPISFDEIWDAIRTGKHGLKEKITQIRNRYEAEKDITGDPIKAKKAIGDLKMELPGFLPVGTFSKRSNEGLVEYSGILCADLDTLGDKLPLVLESLKNYPFVHAIALSPSGDGLKVFFNVVNDPARHEDSFRAIQQFMRDEAGLEIDEKCKDLARICFFTYYPGLWVRGEGDATIPPAAPLPRGKTTAAPSPNMTAREQISFGLLGELRFDTGKGGYFVRCPGESFHSNKTGEKHTILYLSTVPTLTCQHESCSHVVEAFNKVLRSEIGKAERQNSTVHYPHRDVGMWNILDNTNGEKPLTPEKPFIRFVSPNELENYSPPDGIQLIGDYHIVKDGTFIFVIGGPAGVGKSLAITSLAVAGAKGEGTWFGLTVHRQFKTMIIQQENGLLRLSRNFKELDCKELQDYVRISEPPPYGMIFRRDDFRKQVTDCIAEFSPDIVALDPWNSAARDQEQRTYLETFDLVKSVLPSNTVLGILAHTRKPQHDERSTGRGLMNILAGSHVLTSVPRSVFVLQYASDDTEDNEVVWTCCKNNDGELGKRSAWTRRVGLFESVPSFDWATFDASGKDKRIAITQEMMEEVFEGGELLKVLARDKLLEISGASKSACYNALSAKKSRFVDNLIFSGNKVNWRR
jgi:BT4734-like, N-terminal domain